MDSTTDQFVRYFNVAVSEKYALEKRPGNITAEENERQAYFSLFNDLPELLTCLKASRYKLYDMPTELSCKLAEAYVSAHERAEGKLNVVDCLPQLRLEKDALEQLRKTNPKLSKFYEDNLSLKL